MFEKKLRSLNIRTNELKDDKNYICYKYNGKGKKISDEEIRITGRELKLLSEMRGESRGMIKYSREIRYDVIGEEKMHK
ncbi:MULTISPECIES: hypothetical protein [Tissierellales]|jgi:hypothetical protein|uniref:Uncharacterized protein n=1 Tax=Acidilutibacter cellobiosedens TaxID=2507161 RepID=A0A410QG17_9FIRM|nr:MULTISPECIES: hypothetical protein [Tissierellales]QAT63042.1 hypothetical protein EQM13_16450 [Acidilutibacter cellobiosedens]SCL85672.1 hypothetical protein PP176A_0918 [Sporanaerobacter sp. PP17-6a]